MCIYINIYVYIYVITNTLTTVIKNFYQIEYNHFYHYH